MPVAGRVVRTGAAIRRTQLYPGEGLKIYDFEADGARYRKLEPRAGQERLEPEWWEPGDRR